MSDTPTQNPYLIQTNPVENRTVQFFKDSVQVGCFDFGVSPVTFTGDVDESARIFVDYVISKVQTELTAARQELKAVTEQRDRLAEALRKITEYDLGDIPIGVVRKCNEALQTLPQNSQADRPNGSV